MCVCVCVDCYSCSRINEAQVRVSSHVFGFVFVDFQNKLRSRVMPSFADLECHCSLFKRGRSKLVHRVLLLYLVVSSNTSYWFLIESSVISVDYNYVC